MAIFRTAFEQWATSTRSASLQRLIRVSGEALLKLAGVDGTGADDGAALGAAMDSAQSTQKGSN